MAGHQAQNHVEGPFAEEGNITLTGKYVAARDLKVIYNGVPEEEPLPFWVVDREYLLEQALRPKQMYVARAPTWADVVHGGDPELRFIERDQTEALCAAVRAELLEPVARRTDLQLHSLFVLGAPGSGKTTLVRRVAAMLVLAGECVVADFGVKTQQVTQADGIAYIRALDRLAAAGTPVLALVDDPFFANSGWVELLQALGRPQHQGVAVLGASPDFLFQRFTHRLFGKQVLRRTFDVSRPSLAEQEQLLLLHGRDPAGSLTTNEDLLVVAMEAAAGQSFDEIMQRMWMTLNSGVPLDPNVEVRHLPWPVVAFAVVCFFHQNHVLCPEALLHEFLSDTLDETPPSLLAQELQNLVTREGWRIFSVHTPRNGGRLIGTTHARVAREAWSQGPMRGFDMDRTVIDVSARVPAAVPQLAELILARKPALANQLARKFATHWSNAIAAKTAETKSVCALVRALKSSRPARLNFRAVLRKCLLAENDQSWLAAWQLCHLSSVELGPQEHWFLRKTNLPWTLNIADLSAGPHESIDIATRMDKSFQTIISDRLTKSLREDLGWTADVRQVTWLLGVLPDADVVSLLEPVYAWLENDLLAADDEERPSRAYRVVEALMPMFDTDGLLDEEQSARLLTVVLEWLVTTTNVSQGVVLALLSLAESNAAENHPRSEIILSELLKWLPTCHEDKGAEWVAFLATLRRLPNATDLTREAVPEAFAWLKERPEANEQAWRLVLGGFGRMPELADLAHEIIPEAFTWLKKRPEANEQAWRAMLGALGYAPELAGLAQEIIPQALVWLKERPEANERAWQMMLGAFGRIPELTDVGREVIPQAVTWLKERPEANEQAWRAMLGAFGRMPELADVAHEVIPQAFTWLKERPEANEQAWRAMLGALGVLGHLPQFVDLVHEIFPQAFTWLKERPEANEQAWRAMLGAFGVLGHLPEHADLARQIIPRAVAWLRKRPEANEQAWRAMLGVFGYVHELADVARQIIPQALVWLKERPEANEQAWQVMLGVFGYAPELADLAHEIIPQAFTWLKEHPETPKGPWLGLLVALSSPIDLVAEQRAEMLTTMRHATTDSHLLRGVRLLQLADEDHPDLVPVVISEIAYLEDNPSRKSSNMIVQPVAFAVAKTGRADLVARFTAWKQRSLDGHGGDQDEAAAFTDFTDSTM